MTTLAKLMLSLVENLPTRLFTIFTQPAHLLHRIVNEKPPAVSAQELPPRRPLCCQGRLRVHVRHWRTGEGEQEGLVFIKPCQPNIRPGSARATSSSEPLSPLSVHLCYKTRRPAAALPVRLYSSTTWKLS